MSESLWHDASDSLRKAKDAIDAKRNLAGATPDQLLQVAQIEALLAIGQEISLLNPQNTSTRSNDGTERNGWGLPIG